MPTITSWRLWSGNGISSRRAPKAANCICKPVRATGTSRSVSAVLYFVAVQVVHFHFDLVADPTKFISNGFRRAFRTCRVVEIAVYQIAYFSCESRTVFFRISADGDYIVPRFIYIFFYSFWFMMADIDAGGCQCLDGERMHLYGRTDSGGTDCEWFVEWLQPALRHLAKAAVVGAKNQYFHRFLFIVTDAKIINAGLWWLYSKLILFIAWKIFSIYVRYCLLWQLVSCEKQVASFPDQWSCRISFTAAFALCVCTGWDAEELG